MKKLFTLVFAIAMMAPSKSKAVVGGLIPIPSYPKFPTLQVLVDSLNLYGLSGPALVIDLKIDETAPSGGYILNSAILNATVTLARNITLNGNNHTITAPVGSGSMDGIFNIVGVDYITINKLNLVESSSNTTATTMMERGFAILKTSNQNGCKTISIVDCNVTLNNSNTTAASGIAPAGATGIFVGNCTYTSTANLATYVTDSCSHDGMFFSKDTILNINNGIYLVGNPLNTNGTANNEKNATIQENVIQNFTHVGVSLSYFNNDVVQQNQINNTASGGTAPTANAIFGIRYSHPNTSFVTNTNWSCSKNNIELTINTSGNNTDIATGIYTQIYGEGATSITYDTIKITSIGTSAHINGIFSQNTNITGTQNIDNNYIYGFTTQTTNTQSVFGIYAGGYSTYPGLGISSYNSFSGKSTVSKNIITNWNVTSGATANATYANRVMAIVEDLFGAGVSNITANTVSDIVVNNSSVRFVGYGGIWSYNPGTIVTRTTNFSLNTFTNITTSGTSNTTPLLMVQPLGRYPDGHTFNSSTNKINKIVSDAGIVASFISDLCLQFNMVKDTISGISSQNSHAIGLLNGYSLAGASLNYPAKNISMSECSLSDIQALSASSGSFSSAIHLQPGNNSANTLALATISNNLISNVGSKDNLGSAFGITNTGGSGGVNIFNNILSDISAPNNTTAYSSSFGIRLLNIGANSLIFNTIKMNTASTTATGYGATALQYSSAGTNTIQNNILHADVKAGASNNVSAIRAGNGAAKSAPSIAGFTASSNIYYTPTGTNNYLYVEGTTNTSLVNGYHLSGLTADNTKNIVNDTFFNSECDKSSYHAFMQSAAASREENTFTENNLSGASGIYSPSGLSYAEGTATDGAVSIDFTLATRLFGSSDIGALEFAGTTRPQLVTTITSSTGYDTACPYNLPVLTASVPGFFNRVSYQWYRDTTKIVGANNKNFTVGTLSASYIVKAYDSVTGCEYPSEPYKMTIIPPPPAIITYYDSLTFCESSAIVLQANKGYNYSYRWQRNGTFLPSETNDHLVVSTSGDYTLEVNTPLGCETISTPIRVKVYPLPTPSVIYAGPRQLTTQKYYTYQWYKNNIKIDSFSKARTYYCFDDGAYTVEVTDSNGCTAKSDVYLFTLGIGNHPMASAIKLYPNPVQDKLTIESPIGVWASLSDLSGRSVVELQEAKTVDMSHLAEGMYLLSLRDKEGNLIKVEKINKVR